MMHRQETVECLKKFNARRKLKVRRMEKKHNKNTHTHTHKVQKFYGEIQIRNSEDES